MMVSDGGLLFAIPWFVGLSVVLIPLLLLVVLIIVLAGKRRAAPPAASTGPSPPSMDQRRAGLERSRSRYREERSRILGMLESGTVSPEEADRLFDTLDRETSTMACPFCGGSVRIEAIRCKHCKRNLVEGMDRPRQLRKSHDKVLAGVCGGLAEYTGLDASLLRILTALVVLTTGIITGLIVYLVVALIIPAPE